MYFHEIYGNLLTAPAIITDCYLAHCISADFALGAGIALQINNVYDTRNILHKKYPNYISTYNNGDCLIAGNVLNLVTKRNYYDKPTYESLRSSLMKMKDIVLSNNIKTICMPRIGCGLDKLKWHKVSLIIQEIFSDTNVNIFICNYNG